MMNCDDSLLQAVLADIEPLALLILFRIGGEVPGVYLIPAEGVLEQSGVRKMF